MAWTPSGNHLIAGEWVAGGAVSVGIHAWVGA